jgi:hypothetical protein
MQAALTIGVAFCACAWMFAAPCVWASAVQATDPNSNAAAANVIAILPINPSSWCGECIVKEERDGSATGDAIIAVRRSFAARFAPDVALYG